MGSRLGSAVGIRMGLGLGPLVAEPKRGCLRSGFNMLEAVGHTLVQRSRVQKRFELGDVFHFLNTTWSLKIIKFLKEPTFGDTIWKLCIGVHSDLVAPHSENLK